MTNRFKDEAPYWSFVIWLRQAALYVIAIVLDSVLRDVYDMRTRNAVSFSGVVVVLGTAGCTRRPA